MRIRNWLLLLENNKTEKLINYNNYNYYNYYNLDKMENTTIAISKEVKEGIIEFGNKGEIIDYERKGGNCYCC
mgnify:CR=1 FL=1